jgi:polyhydroxybutyrate depolymerase
MTFAYSLHPSSYVVRDMTMQRLLSIFVLISGILAANYAQAADSQSYKLTDSDHDRSYLVYRPANLNKSNPVPLVIMLHGGFGSGSQAEHAYNWDVEADREGFVVAYPDGVGRSWNAGGMCCGSALRDNVDDLGFLTKLIATLIKSENIDPSRVYMTGMSNGAVMSYRYACEGTYPIAAIGPVSGTASFVCAKPHAVSVMEIHGVDDHNIPIEGGQGSKGVTKGAWLPVQQTLDTFRSANNCQTSSTQQSGPVHITVWNCADSHSVNLITIDGAGHQWPGSKPRTGLMGMLMNPDTPSQSLDATSTLWTFFKGQRSKP